MHTPHSHRKTPFPLTAFGALLAVLLAPASVLAQGCVIARGSGAAAITDGTGYLEKGEWQLTQGIRHFKSHRHYAGTVEQTYRSDQGTEVYNDSWFYDTTLTYAWSKRINLTLTVPFVNHDRSSMYEHLGNNSGQRFSTQSSGLADIQTGLNVWVIDPNKAKNWNVFVGAGIKFPTGDAEAKDIFMRPTGPQLRYVDSSIQPGDGGTGFSISLGGYYMLEHWVHNLSIYANGFYLFNPEERNENTGFSIPDTYMARGGLEYRIEGVRGLSTSLGIRDEGVAAHDAFGGSRGSRRPGFAVAVEPGVTYQKGRYTATFTLPIAVHRNRLTTFGQKTPGDAAFADYTYILTVSMKL